MHKRILWVLLFFSASHQAQNINSEFNVDVMGLIPSGDSNPFWFTHNTHYRFGESSNFSGLAAGTARYSLSENASLNGGISVYYRDEVPNEFQRETLYFNYTNRWLRATLGSQKNHDPSLGLSSSAQNFLMSGNARPLPGLLLEANQPIRLGNFFSIDWGIGHYLLNDDRYVRDPYVHYKRLGVKWQWNVNNSFKARLQHFAIWGGTSPEYGELSSDFGAFIDVFFATQPESDPVPGEALNALGNHLGSYFFEYSTNQDWGMLNIYHEHPFEDGSGSGWANFPDGIWGVLFQPENTSFVSAFLYEYINTTNQSERTSSGADNYFSNSVYRSGWTYEGNIIGIPFILNDPTLEITPDTNPIISNRLRGHQFGVRGEFDRFNWLLKSSIVTNYFRGSEKEGFTFLYNALFVEYKTPNYGILKGQLGWDNGESIDSRFGIGIGYAYYF